MKIMKKKRDIFIFKGVLWQESGQLPVSKFERYFMMKIFPFLYGVKLWKKYTVELVFCERNIKVLILSFILIPNLLLDSVPFLTKSAPKLRFLTV